MDNFVTTGDPAECAGNLMIMERTRSDLGMLVETAKTESPATVITFLGLELDTGEPKILNCLIWLRYPGLTSSGSGSLARHGMV